MSRPTHHLPPKAAESELLLVQACLKGDGRAHRQLYDIHKGKMFGVCLRYANNRQEAEDLLQEGFVQVFKDLGQYRGEGSLEGWIRKVMVRMALQQIRKQKIRYVELDGQLEARADVSENDDFNQEMARNLLRLMHQMPTGFRTVLNLYVFEGFTHREIGEALNISENTSKTQYLRAKEHLKRLLEKSLSV